jgi:hypothetical protein
VVSGGVLSIAGAVVVCLALPGFWRYDARTSRASARAAAGPAQPGLRAPGDQADPAPEAVG